MDMDQKVMQGIFVMSVVADFANARVTASELQSWLSKKAGDMGHCQEIERPDLKVKVHVLVGDAAQEIVALADREDESLIAMSSHGAGWLQQMVVGSATYEMAKTANRPVLIVRSEK